MKLFVDDIRTCPDVSEFLCCRDFDSAIRVLSHTNFEHISLDYDLGYGCKTGLNILEWMSENHKSAPSINIHSSHPIGRSRMYDFAKKHFPNSNITMYSVR